ncbi:MAG: transketolase C-terminal domain-containing protein [Nitrospirota bacterium]
MDITAVNQIAEVHDIILSLEEHNIHGGLGSAVAEVLAENSYRGHFKRIGISDSTGKHIGTADYLREKHGLTPETIYNQILKIMKIT